MRKTCKCFFSYAISFFEIFNKFANINEEFVLSAIDTILLCEFGKLASIACHIA